MPIWHLIVTRGEKTLMDELRDALSILRKLGTKMDAVSDAVDGVAAAQDRLNETQAIFRPAWEAAQELMAANPGVEAVECAGTKHVLVRLPTGSVAVLPLTHWSELEMPDETPEPPPVPEGVANEILTSIGFRPDDYLARVCAPLKQEQLARIQAGKPTKADIDCIAAAHAYSHEFDDPDLPEEAE